MGEATYAIQSYDTIIPKRFDNAMNMLESELLGHFSFSWILYFVDKMDKFLMRMPFNGIIVGPSNSGE